MEYFVFDLKTLLPSIIKSGVTLLIFIFIRYIAIKFIRKITVFKDNLNKRANLIIKYLNFIWGFFLILALIAIWGLDTKEISSFFISIAAFIGVAFFAQWSVLNNITGGIVLFFSYPFKIGDVIRIMDKDFPIIARIDDISAFYIILTTKEGETITYPNNMMLQKAVVLIDDIEIIKSIPIKY